MPSWLLARLETKLENNTMADMEMGDDSACALGVSVERSRLMMMGSAPSGISLGDCRWLWFTISAANARTAVLSGGALPVYLAT